MVEISFIVGPRGRTGGVASYCDLLGRSICERLGQQDSSKVFFQETDLDVPKEGLTSLQFVPHAFHPKGLPRGLTKKLCQARNRQWHIFFHETWLGGQLNQLPHYYLYGAYQRILAKSLARRLAPAHIHTSNWFYQRRLASIGIKAAVLPVFSNIGLYRPKPSENFGKSGPLEPGRKIIVLFGALPPFWNVEPLLQMLSEALGDSERLLLLSIGRAGAGGPKFLEAIQRHANHRVEAKILGEMEPMDISLILSSADAGLVPTYLGLLDKSGAYAAMILHGLPVICTSPKFWLPEDGYPENVWTVGLSEGPVLEHISRRFPPIDRLPAAVEAYLAILNGVPC